MQKTLFVAEDPNLPCTPKDAISFDTYLRDYPKLSEPKIRVINLCDTQHYLSQGYYCSLLAEARKHAVLPDVKTINTLRDSGTVLWLETQLFKTAGLPEHKLHLTLCMGEPINGQFPVAADYIFRAVPAPLLRAVLIPEAKGVRAEITGISLNDLSESEQLICGDLFSRSASSRWNNRKTRKKYRWDMAILVDPEEKVPPSNKGAIDRFIKAADRLGIRANTIHANDVTNVNQFDALFIRETTAISHHTYQIARRAEEQGLIVIDDTNSILRCCNKVFLHDAFNYQKVPSLRTEFISDASAHTLASVEARFGFPLILKMPEGSFSKGVFKVNNLAELKTRTEQLLNDSALVLAQEYLFTEFDWRIGVLGDRALYACRYYMARNHWQIYNHGSSRNFSGGFDALPTFEVPPKVLQAALKASAVVGRGLYGIDIKEVNGEPYVLEVNDNPSIDHNVEDAYLGDELYMQIMAEFLRRLERRGH